MINTFHDLIIKSQKKICWWRWLVEAKWELPVSGGPQSRFQTAAELWRHPTKTRCRPFYITIVPLSLSFSRCLFLQLKDFAGFFRYWNSGAPGWPPYLLYLPISCLNNCNYFCKLPTVFQLMSLFYFIIIILSPFNFVFFVDYSKVQRISA